MITTHFQDHDILVSWTDIYSKLLCDPEQVLSLFSSKIVKMKREYLKIFPEVLWEFFKTQRMGEKTKSSQ